MNYVAARDRTQPHELSCDGLSDLFLGPRLFLMLERGFSLNNQLLTRVRIRSAITGIGMHVLQWAELTTLLVLALPALFQKKKKGEKIPDLKAESEISGS